MPKYGGCVERPYEPSALSIDEEKVDDADAYPVTVSEPLTLFRCRVLTLTLDIYRCKFKMYMNLLRRRLFVRSTSLALTVSSISVPIGFWEQQALIRHCAGAHSWVRKALDIQAVGDRTGKFSDAAVLLLFSRLLNFVLL